MSDTPTPAPEKDGPEKQRPFRRALLRGLAIILPPLLTILIFIWAWTVIVAYVLVPIENIAISAIMLNVKDIHREVPADVNNLMTDTDGNAIRFKYGDRWFEPMNEYPSGKVRWVPDYVKASVEQSPAELLPTTANGYFRRYIQTTYLQRWKTIPVFLIVFVLVLYLVGKLLAAGIGRFFVNIFEKMIHRLPIIRTVYSASKQVTDFVFKEHEVEFTRVIGVQYPRKGIWSMGFVTGEGFMDFRDAAGEPVLSVLMPTSPVPATGFTITVPKSETIDLDITVDQAVQFCVSCGVVVPPHQQWNKSEIAAAFSAQVAAAQKDSSKNGDGQAEAKTPAGDEEPSETS